MKKTLSILSIISLLIATSVSSAKFIEIKFAHTTGGTTHPKVKAANTFADRVNTEMADKVKVTVFGGGQLGSVPQILEGMLLGDIQMGAPSLSKFEQFTKKYRIFDLPFIFKNIQAVDRFQNSPKGRALLNAMNQAGLKGLEFWHNGMKQMSANLPLIEPSDAEGLKFRIMTSDVLKSQIEAIGGIPQKMSFKEVFGALQTGIVDGQENTWSNIYTKKFFEVQDGITETNHGILDYLVVTSQSFWDGLPGDIRRQLETILKEVTAESNANSYKINQQNRQKILEAGGKIRQLTAKQREVWVKAMRPVWQHFIKDVGIDVLDAALRSN